MSTPICLCGHPQPDHPRPACASFTQAFIVRVVGGMYVGPVSGFERRAMVLRSKAALFIRAEADRLACAFGTTDDVEAATT